MSSFIPVSSDSDFSLHNIPFGVVSNGHDASLRCASIIGETVIDLRALSRAGKFSSVKGYDQSWFEQTTLNDFASQDLATRRAVRSRIQDLFKTGSELEKDEVLRSKATFHVKEAKLHMPIFVRDYTDFCASYYHTANAGRLMKVQGPPVPPAWNMFPIGYHGRASSIVVSGTPIVRPTGMRPPPPDKPEVGMTFGPTKTLDLEYEMAAVVGGKTNKHGQRLSLKDVEENVFGLVIMNDWSAREHQGAEMFPLGPFNGKNFGTTISPWIVTLDALAPFKTSLPERNAEKPLPDYLQDSDDKPTYDLPLTMTITAASENEPTLVMKSNLRHLAYSFAQMLAHQTVSGCPASTGDMLGSGTISGPDPDSLACLLEITERGSKPIRTAGGGSRVWLEDGDKVDMFAQATRRTSDGEIANVGFGVCSGTIAPAI